MTVSKTFLTFAAVSLLTISGISIPALAQIPDFQAVQGKSKDKSNNGNNKSKKNTRTSVPEPHAAWILLPALAVVGLRERRRRRPAAGRNRKQ